jgi:hypothetical protein
LLSQNEDEDEEYDEEDEEYESEEASQNLNGSLMR